MQNDRNVSSDDNKNAISLDNIIDEFGNSTGTRKNDSKLGEAMKKLDEMFNREKEDLAWLDNIMNSGVTGNKERDNGTVQAPVSGNPFGTVGAGNNTAPDLNGITDDDFIPDGVQGAPAAASVIVPDLSVMPEEDSGAPAVEAPFGQDPDDDIFADIPNAENYNIPVSDAGEQQYDDVIRAENADDDTKIFGSSERAAAPEAGNGYPEWNADGSQSAPMYDNAGAQTAYGAVNVPPEMQNYPQSPMSGMPVQTDKKLEKKRRKEERRLARAQAKAMKAQMKAQKNAEASYMYGQPQQGAPDMYSNYGADQDQQMQDVPEGMMQDIPAEQVQFDAQAQGAPEVIAQDIPAEQVQFGAQAHPEVMTQDIPAEQIQTDVQTQIAPETAQQDTFEEPVQQDVPVQQDEIQQSDDNNPSDTDNDPEAVSDAETSDSSEENVLTESDNTAAEQVSEVYTDDNGQASDDPQAIESQEGAAPDFEMFEGAQPEGEYVHNVENAAQQQENDVNSSLGKLFGVDIPDDDDTKKASKKRSEHKKIAKELGAYEEINMADPDAVNNARRHYFVKRRHSMVSLFGAALFFLVGLYAELSMLGLLPVPAIVNARSNPTLFALADLQIMCFGAIFVIDSLISGFYSLLDKRFSPASCALTVFIACAVQAVISAVFGGSVKLQMFCCVGGFAIFMLALYDSLRASADFKSFNIASSTANKYGAYELGVDSLECSPFASHIDLEKAKVISVNKGSVYEGFVGRNEKRPEGEKKLGRLTLIITIISLLVGVFVAFFSDGNIKERIYDGITGAAIVLTSSVPLNVFFVSALPKYLAVKKGNKIGATLIGQNASEEYKGLSVVAFEDTEVFLPKDVRISSIKTYGGMALDEAVITMANIYNKIGGPLSKIFAKMVDVKSIHSEVRLVKVYPDAIEVNVDGRDYCLATASYLGANGIRIINDGVDAAFEQSHGSILFMVCSGRVLAKFYIKYSMNPVFEKTLRELHDANLCIGIKTLDPCITNDLVFGCLERANYALSVIKGNSSSDIPVVRNKVNSGVISLGSVHSFLEMLLICEKTGRNVKINNVIKLISAILCILLSTVFVLTNNGSLNIIFCLLIQLFWLLPVAAVSYLNR